MFGGRSSGAFGNSALGAAGGHLFWRDPDKGLIGACGDGLLLGDKVGAGVWTAVEISTQSIGLSYVN